MADGNSKPLQFPKLLTPDEAEACTGVPAARLVQLAEAGYVPYWRVDGGPVRFERHTVRRWVRENLMHSYPAAAFPKLTIIKTLCAAADPKDVPVALATLVGLLNGPDRCPGVYFLCLGGEVVYVGQSHDVVTRVMQHVGVKEFDRWYWLPVEIEKLNEVEADFIRSIKPRGNKHPMAAGRRLPYYRGRMPR